MLMYSIKYQRAPTTRIAKGLPAPRDKPETGIREGEPVGIRGTGEKRGKRAKTPSHLRACGETHRVSARAAPAAPRGPGHGLTQGCKKNDAAARARARARGREAAGREAAGRGAPPPPPPPRVGAGAVCWPVAIGAASLRRSQEVKKSSYNVSIIRAALAASIYLTLLDGATLSRPMSACTFGRQNSLCRCHSLCRRGWRSRG